MKMGTGQNGKEDEMKERKDHHGLPHTTDPSPAQNSSHHRFLCITASSVITVAAVALCHRRSQGSKPKSPRPHLFVNPTPPLQAARLAALYPCLSAFMNEEHARKKRNKMAAGKKE
jgi:hypothetical protein